MEDFGRKLQQIRQKAIEERRHTEKHAWDRQELDRAQRVDEAASGIEAHIESRLRQFMKQFTEFHFDAHVDRGRHLRVYWDDPTGGRARLYQLALRVRRYHEYADVEVDVKMIVANAEKPRYLREEDVLEGNVDLLEDFIDQQICRFARLYSAERAFDD